MRLSKNQLSIVVNPFAAPLSAEGRCMALCAADPAEGGARYIGARTVAKSDPARRSMLAVGGKTLGRDKVSVSYSLAPVTVADTSYYRNALRAGDVFIAEGAAARLQGAACASLAAFEADGGDRAQALASWRAQGLAAIADAIDPPQPDAAKIAKILVSDGQKGAVEMSDLIKVAPAPPSGDPPVVIDRFEVGPKPVDEPASAGEGAIS